MLKGTKSFKLGHIWVYMFCIEFLCHFVFCKYFLWFILHDALVPRFIFLFLVMYILRGRCSECHATQSLEEGTQSIRAEVAGGCEPPEMDAKN